MQITLMLNVECMDFVGGQEWRALGVTHFIINKKGRHREPRLLHGCECQRDRFVDVRQYENKRCIPGQLLKLTHDEANGVEAMAAAGTVAVLLPGAFYTVRETTLPPVDALRAARVPIAIATDGNPGSSPLFSVLTAMNMACTLFRLTPEEALAGVTREGARALGLASRVGTVAPGQRAELAIWDVEHPAELAYRIGFNALHATVTGGHDD